MLLSRHYKYPVGGHDEQNNSEGFICIAKVACCVYVYIQKSKNNFYSKSYYIGVKTCEVNVKKRNTG
jgi:hypothetical protein